MRPRSPCTMHSHVAAAPHGKLFRRKIGDVHIGDLEFPTCRRAYCARCRRCHGHRSRVLSQRSWTSAALVFPPPRVLFRPRQRRQRRTARDRTHSRRTRSPLCRAVPPAEVPAQTEPQKILSSQRRAHILAADKVCTDQEMPVPVRQGWLHGTYEMAILSCSRRRGGSDRAHVTRRRDDEDVLYAWQA